MGKCYGKYRAVVTDRNDPELRGRIKVSCPKVYGIGQSTWCEPCYPCAYECGGDFYVPKSGDTVWVEFEEGDPTKPIWVGNWFSAGASPIANATYSSIGINSRRISFENCAIMMKKDELVLRVGNSILKLTPNRIDIN